jgi:hypothetical protein
LLDHRLVAIRIEMKTCKPGVTWETLGRFRASEAEIAQLRELIEDKDLLAALDTLPGGIVRDTLDVILREHGHEARVQFVED